MSAVPPVPPSSTKRGDETPPPPYTGDDFEEKIKEFNALAEGALLSIRTSVRNCIEAMMPFILAQLRTGADTFDISIPPAIIGTQRLKDNFYTLSGIFKTEMLRLNPISDAQLTANHSGHVLRIKRKAMTIAKDGKIVYGPKVAPAPAHAYSPSPWD